MFIKGLDPHGRCTKKNRMDSPPTVLSIVSTRDDSKYINTYYVGRNKRSVCLSLCSYRLHISIR